MKTERVKSAWARTMPLRAAAQSIRFETVHTALVLEALEDAWLIWLQAAHILGMHIQDRNKKVLVSLPVLCGRSGHSELQERELKWVKRLRYSSQDIGLGETKYFVGVLIEWKEGVILLHQAAYCKIMLERFLDKFGKNWLRLRLLMTWTACLKERV